MCQAFGECKRSCYPLNSVVGPAETDEVCSEYEHITLEDLQMEQGSVAFPALSHLLW